MKFATIILNKERSAMSLKKLPPKLKDPGSFSIPCVIGNLSFYRALCDFGAIVCLILFIRSWGHKNPNPLTFPFIL